MLVQSFSVSIQKELVTYRVLRLLYALELIMELLYLVSLIFNELIFCRKLGLKALDLHDQIDIHRGVKQ